jgi:hypothetical protein
MTALIENKSVHLVDGYEVSVEAGKFVKIDGNALSRMLLVGDDFSPFRLESHSAVCRSVACRVEITGRKIRWDHGRSVRVRVVFVGDGEPDVVASGWLFF